jgi:hypothetical protein
MERAEENFYAIILQILQVHRDLIQIPLPLQVKSRAICNDSLPIRVGKSALWPFDTVIPIAFLSYICSRRIARVVHYIDHGS